MSTRRLMLAGAGGSAVIGALTATATSRSSAAGARGGYFPNALVQNQDGHRFRFYDDILHGKRVAVNMMYASCAGVCPANTANLLRVQEMLGRRLGSDIFMVSLTLQPEFDRPRDLRNYMDRYGIGPGWTFLTGTPADMQTIRRKLGFYSLDPQVDRDLIQHTGMVRVGNEPLERWRMMPALASPQQIVRALLES